MEDQWLAWAKRLHALASTGVHFAREAGQDFDGERYNEIGEIAGAMLAALGDVPLARIQDLLGAPHGYATPKVDVRGAIIRGDTILLVRERSDGLWTMPGGYADVGISGAENVEKEVWEEANIRVEAKRLFAIRHKAKHAYNPDPRDFYKLFFLCEQTDDAVPSAGLETADAGFYSLAALPPLSRGRVIEADIEAAFNFFGNPARETLFD